MSHYHQPHSTTSSGIQRETLSKDNLLQVTSSRQLNIGDILYRRKGMVMHVGVYIGNELILHNTPKHGEHSTDFDTFANGKTVFAKATQLPSDQVIKNASEILSSPEQYQLFKRNCEHTANGVIRQNPASDQLEEIWAWALIGGAFGKSFGKPTMYLGGAIGAIGGLISLPRMFWLNNPK